MASNTTLNDTSVQTQPFTIYSLTGEPIPCDLAEVRSIMRWGTQCTIVAAAQAGAALAVLVVLLLITKSEKRRHWAFWSNAFALLMTVITQSINSAYFLDGWYDPYPVLTGDFSFIPRGPKVASIIGGFCVVLLVLAIETSLLLQTYALTTTLSFRTRLYVLTTGSILALAAVALRTAQFIDSAIVQDLHAAYNSNATLLHARDILLTLSVVFFSAVFLLKLGAAIRTRKLLGMPRARPMQVIFAGFTQAMALPALFALCQFADEGSTIDELVLTSVALCLPLTAISAAFVADGPVALGSGPKVRRVVVVRSEHDVESGKYGASASVSAGSEVEMLKM